MAEENTGYLAYSKLKKVADGGVFDGQALDDNNELCSVSGLPQSKKDNNISDPDYAEPIYDVVSCPLVPTTVFTLNTYSSTSSNPILEIFDDTNDTSVHVAGMPYLSDGPYNMTVIDDAGTYTMTLTFSTPQPDLGGLDFLVNSIAYTPVETSGMVFTFLSIPKGNITVNLVGG